MKKPARPAKKTVSSKPPHAGPPAYKNPALPVARRVKDLLARMTLAEKAAQMMCVWQEKAQTLVDAAGNFDPAKAATAFKHGHGIGQVGRPSDAGAPPALLLDGWHRQANGGAHQRDAEIFHRAFPPRHPGDFP